MFYDLSLIDPTKKQAVIVNGSGVDLEYYSPGKICRSESVFLMVARLLVDKGINEYVGAAMSLKARYPYAKFLVLGPLDRNPSSVSKIQIEEWASSGVIEYLGEAKDVRPYIEAANVFVLPSYREGTPRTVLEAMAMGKPIITTDAPGCKETVTEGVNGFLVPVQDIESLANAMEFFILKPELITKMGKVSRKIAEDKYNVYLINKVMMKSMRLLRHMNT